MLHLGFYLVVSELDIPPDSMHVRLWCLLKLPWWHTYRQVDYFPWECYPI
jgi:hypothetical protein